MESDLGIRLFRTIGFVVRLVLLLALIGGLVVTSAASLPSPRTLEQFRGAALAGRIDQVNYWVGDSRQVMSLEWSESPLAWYRVDGRIRDSEGPYTVDRLAADFRHVFDQPYVVVQEPGTESSAKGIIPDWPFDVPGGWWIAGAWVLAFFVMLGSTPRLANRWAWFWLFTVGQIGALLHLVLEPRPLWRGPGEGTPRAKRVDGSSGCGYSILLAVVTTAAGVGIAWIVGRVVG
ncbi:hypothetical protein [Nonomuraea maritima]|uniref:hypothetical protein n=1 Tax=Nonomuraea maritima TaxID=683260 RepID=UPI003715D670